MIILLAGVMRRSSPLDVSRHILCLAAVAVVLVISIILFSAEDDDGWCFLSPGYLSLENQDDDPGCYERVHSSIACAFLSSYVPKIPFPEGCLSEAGVDLRISPIVVSSHLNRAPPLNC